MSAAAKRLLERDLSQTGTPRDIADLRVFRRAILCGAGGSAGEVQKVLDGWGIEIVAYADNSLAKQGSGFRGRPVLAPAAIPAHLDGSTAVIIASVFQREIAEQLSLVGVPAQVVFPFVSPMFAGHFGQPGFEGSSEGLRWLRSRLQDAESRLYLDSLLKFRWSMSPALLARNLKVTGFYKYDSADLGPRAGDHIVDVGAYDGDSAVAYLERIGGVGRISAMEPSPSNLEALESTIRRCRLADRVWAVPFGAGEVPSTAEIDSDGGIDPRATLRTGGGSRVTIRIETIDRLFANDRVDFIKIDIEGHDPAALKGAATVLKRDRPGLAIAAYHAPDHVWRIPALLDRLCPGYRMYLGHHQSAAYECELFCVHESRV